MRQHALLDLFFEGSPSFFDCFSALEGLDVTLTLIPLSAVAVSLLWRAVVW
jgi:hypothetical protein